MASTASALKIRFVETSCCSADRGADKIGVFLAIKEYKFMIVELSKADINDHAAVKLILNKNEINEEHIDQLLEVLKQTTNLLVANNIGFKLKQYKYNRILQALIEVISRPETINRRGKLIFSCEGYDCTKYFELFVEIALQEPGESCINAIDVIGEMKGPLSNDQLSNALDKVGTYVEKNENIPYLKKLKKHLKKLM